MKKFLTRKKIYLIGLGIVSFWLLIFLGIFLQKKFQSKPHLGIVTNERLQAENLLPAPNNNYFRVSYEKFKDIYSYSPGESLQSTKVYGLEPIQVFGGGLVLGEFLDKDLLYNGNPMLFAGHLGNFWAPPYFSEQNDQSGLKSQEGFSTSLAIVNRNHPGIAKLETDADHSQTKAFWSPAKMEVENFYPGCGQGTRVKGIKMAIPNERGFVLKLNVKNECLSSQPFNLLLLASIPNLGKNTNWTWRYGGGWERPVTDLVADFKQDERVVIIKSQSKPVYLLLGPQNPNFSWQVNNSSSSAGILEQFKNNGELLNSRGEENFQNSGLTAGFSFRLDPLPKDKSVDIVLLGFVGGSENEVLNRWRVYKNKSAIEQEIETKMNQKIANMFNNYLPKVSFPEKRLEKIYYYSALQYLLNRWENLDLLSEQNFRANSVAFFPWTTGTESFFAMVDPIFWRRQLIKQINLDYSKCRAYSPLGNLCDVNYSYSVFSLVRQVAEYVFLTEDKQLLAENISGKRFIDKLAQLVNFYDEKAAEGDLIEGSKRLVDFGSDAELYELSYSGCGSEEEGGLGGIYTGFVPSPNAERYNSHYLLSQLYQEFGDTQASDLHFQLAKNNQEALMTLWDNDTGWFKTGDLYYSNLPGQTAVSHARTDRFFYFQPIYNLLGFEGLLNENQKEKILSSLDKFIGPRGFYSIAINQQKEKCSRADWQGPGLYSGSIGLFLSDLFQSHKKEEAYDALQKYFYLSEVPIWLQYFHANSQKNLARDAKTRSWYNESVSLAQTLIKGMMGLNNSEKIVWLKPQVPSKLLNQGDVIFNQAFSKGSLWSLKASKRNERYEITIAADFKNNPVSSFNFGYEADKPALVKIYHLQPGTYSLKTNGQNTALLSSFSADSTQLNNSDTLAFILRPGRNEVYLEKRTSNTPTLVPSGTVVPTRFISPTITPAVSLTPTPTLSSGSLSCTGGCYGSSSNCQKNCGWPCTVIKGITVENMCGWLSYYQAYRCCTGVTQVTPTLTPVPGLTSVPTPTPTISGGLSCSGGCYGSSSNCQKNCGRPCVVLDNTNMQQMCGWPSGYKAYRCCR